MEKIDFVLPWVDGNDPDWQNNKKNFCKEKKSAGAHVAHFRDMESLKYVLRSIEQHCSWYNRIYLITTGHYPNWLNIDHERIVLVKHDELYFDTTHLPVFNSSSIEMNLPNLKGLSDKFIYLNDDMVIMKSLNSSRFFVGNVPVDFFAHGWLPRNWLFERIRGMDMWLYSLRNNIFLINKKLAPFNLSKDQLYHPTYSLANKISNFLLKNVYKKAIWFEHWHHPQPYLKKTLSEVYGNFSHEMMISSKNRFRAKNDLTQYLYRYWQLATGNFVPHKYNDAYIPDMSTPKIFAKELNKIKSHSSEYNFICFNDNVLDDEDFEKIKLLFIDYMESIFPDKASFEI